MTVRFNQLGLSNKALAAVERLGYETPTPVQARAIPLVLQGRDIIAAAKTGTGKTAAFSLPVLSTLSHVKQGQGPKLLVVTPTRELALQIAAVCETIAKSTHHRIATVVGGVPYAPQINQLKSGVDVLIATPGRLIDLMEKKAVKLGNVEVLVLDEADRMLDMGFWPSVKKIAAAIPVKRQTLLFSATIDKTILNSSGVLLDNPEFVEIAHRGETADSVDQYIVRIPQTLKPLLLKAVLEEKGANRVIVFTRTRSRSDSCMRRLRRAGFSADAIHSDRSQSQRKRALDNFSNGKTAILVATDVLARGIDVSEVDYVVNYDIPSQPEDYIHRIGRTGRAGKGGFAISFVSPEQKDDLKGIEKLIKKDIPEMTLTHFDQRKAELTTQANKAKYSQQNTPDTEATKKAQAKPENKVAAETENTNKAKGRGPIRKTSQKHQTNLQMRKSRKPKKPSAPQTSSATRKTEGTDMRPGRAYRASRVQRHSKTS